MQKKKIEEKQDYRKERRKKKRRTEKKTKISGYVHLCLGKVERGINYKANKKGYETEKKKKKNK